MDQIVSKYGFETTEARSSLMKKIKSKNTTPELKLRKVLWSLGIRYRLNSKSIIGKPDISIKKYKIVIFIDGEFWHGYKWKEKRDRIKSNREYWIPKIEKNMKRDRKYNRLLKKDGWKVFRFWEHQIKKDVDSCVKKIVSHIKKISKKQY